jgi:uncharacterized membrane protein YeiH
VGRVGEVARHVEGDAPIERPRVDEQPGDHRFGLRQFVGADLEVEEHGDGHPPILPGPRAVCQQNGHVDQPAVFVIPLWADLLAIGVGSLQGALFAAQFRDRRLDLLGVAIIGIATGFGGGLMRDVLLGEVPRALQNNAYLLVATGAALLGMLLERLFHRLRHLITALDALTLGLFGAIGTTAALAAGLPEVPAVFVGAITAVGGSILRDLLLTLPIALMHVGSLYAVAAIFGATSIVALSALGVSITIAALVGTGITFLVRILAVLFRWSLPEQRSLTRWPRRRGRSPGDPGPDSESPA